MKQTLAALLLALALGILAGCTANMPNSPNNEQQSAVQSEDHTEECGTCGGNPPPPGGSGGGG
jgi:outer membrane biogenesis lipoprotein LolB